MKTTLSGAAVIVGLVLAVLSGTSISAQEKDKQDKYTLQVPGGLAFSEFKGYEDWQAVGPSQTDAANVIRLILANPVMIDAYKEGVPGNGKPFPDGVKIAKIMWTKKTNPLSPYAVEIPDTLAVIAFIEKDSKRFPDTSGWGYAQFDYDAKSGTFTPYGKDATFGKSYCYDMCHSRVKATDYIFTAYPLR